MALYSPKETMAIVDQWDFIQPRIVGSRDKSDYFPTDRKIMIGYTNKYKKVKGSPTLNWEAYFGNFHKDKATGKQERSFVGARFDYANEKTIADHYVTDYQKNIRDQAAGWVAWMLEETQGEGYLTYLNGMSLQKSLGSCAVDQNRFPKLTYQIYKNALWVPFSIRPGVALQSHWNLSGDQEVDAWSNCPKVELFLNGVSKGTVVPDEKLRCTWKAIPWESGTLKAVGLDRCGPGGLHRPAHDSGRPASYCADGRAAHNQAVGRNIQDHGQRLGRGAGDRTGRRRERESGARWPTTIFGLPSTARERTGARPTFTSRRTSPSPTTRRAIPNCRPKAD